MDFENPQRLWLLLGLPPLILWAWRAARLRARGWKVLGQWGAPPRDRSVGILIALTFAVLALARPRIGFAPDEPIGPGQDVILAFDVSRSMAAEDATPNRLGLAVETARSLVDVLAREPADRAGVVAFAGRGVLRCPLTQNMGAVVDAMDRLRPGDVKPGGTDLAAALDAAVEAFDPTESEEGRTVVVFTDGEDHEGRWEEALERAIARGVVVHAIALGDAEDGNPVPSGTPDQPLTYRGEPVVSRRNDAALDAIAERSGGAVLKLGLATADLGLLYRERIAPVALARRRASKAADRPERFPLFLAASLGFLIAACRPGDRVRRPRRFPRNAARSVILGLALTQVGADPAPETAAAAVARGRTAYDAGRFAEALAAFEAAAARAPDRAVPAYDVAATLYQMDRHAEAVARYQEARVRADAALRTKIDYALGNAAIGLGDLPNAVRHYDACLASTAPGEALDAVRSDAAINRRFALEQLQEAISRQDEPAPDDPSDRKDTPDGTPRGGEAKPDDGPGDDPEGRSGDADPSGGRETDRPSPRKRGGAGGDDPSPPGGSPDARLDDALEQIRDARRRRLPDEPPPDAPRAEGKDW
ncbi:VWA domain-containing protein [Paludisphaera mucosa]|uniref:VWA domain-containing protein n=1 Tax=Paludisphaera mucosa TaxID=3030827 RepID=A0ABT6FBZ0_9BACT|nr:VWA domain-containing protein [Paludisphaera mucosa]MDG3005086.1 VWA domain-containing protein [Paludisphaera mucosa]